MTGVLLWFENNPRRVVQMCSRQATGAVSYFVERQGQDFKYCRVEGNDWVVVGSIPAESAQSGLGAAFVRPDIVLVHQGDAWQAPAVQQVCGFRPDSRSLFLYSGGGNPGPVAKGGVADATRIVNAIDDLKEEDFSQLLAWSRCDSDTIPRCCQAQRPDFTLAAAVAARGALLLPAGQRRQWLFKALAVSDAVQFTERLQADMLAYKDVQAVSNAASDAFKEDDDARFSVALQKLAETLEHALR